MSQLFLLCNNIPAGKDSLVFTVSRHTQLSDRRTNGTHTKTGAVMFSSNKKSSFKAPASDLTGRHIIVTGCGFNSLGYETARQLLNWGADVTVTTRNNANAIVGALQQDTAADYQGRIHGNNLDLTQEQSIQQFIDWYTAQKKPLHVLINNAGIHLDLLSKFKEPKLSPAGLELQWHTNYIGTTQLTMGLLPLLLDSAQASQHSRVVNVSSQLHNKGDNAEFFNPTRAYNSWEAYGQSKLALIHFTQELHRRYHGQNLSAYSLHPGAVATNIGNVGLQNSPILLALKKLLSPIEKMTLKSLSEGAQTQVFCATSADAESGCYYQNGRTRPLSDTANDTDVARRLWKQEIDA
ncbi:MAG: SDR family NAD(P)-dependent oxidoreductase [Pseudomonadota bacterium]